MTSTREGVNPLRPYYIPPTIGDHPSPSPSPFTASGTATNSSRYASKARDVLTDIDYNNYLGDSSPSIVQSAKDLIDELLWKYTSVLMAQPFEVAKIILQVRNQDERAAQGTLPEPEVPKKRASSHGGSLYDFPESDSDADESALFGSNAPDESRTISHGRGTARDESPMPSPRSGKKMALPDHYLDIRRADSVGAVLSNIWQKEGAWGVWKGSNATFLYTVLQNLLENWGRSFLSAIFNVPDLGLKDDIDRLVDIASPYPWASLFVAAAAAVATGVLLAPLDLVRTKLIMTPTSRGQRRTLATLRSLPSYFCSSIVLLPTILHSLVHPIFTLSTPLVLRTRFMIDSQVSPMAFSLAKFCASSASIFIKLPLETVLRRGHMSVLSTEEYVATDDEKLETIAPIGTYDGVFGTMYHIISNEGQREVVPASPAPTKKGKKAKANTIMYKQGQGMDGLWRGWKVSWWGLVGLWTASLFGNGGEGEF